MMLRSCNLSTNVFFLSHDLDDDAEKPVTCLIMFFLSRDLADDPVGHGRVNDANGALGANSDSVYLLMWPIMLRCS
jgi:hypothetical protein